MRQFAFAISISVLVAMGALLSRPVKRPPEPEKEAKDESIPPEPEPVSDMSESRRSKLPEPDPSTAIPDLSSDIRVLLRLWEAADLTRRKMLTIEKALETTRDNPKGIAGRALREGLERQKGRLEQDVAEIAKALNAISGLCQGQPKLAEPQFIAGIEEAERQHQRDHERWLRISFQALTNSAASGVRPGFFEDFARNRL